MSLEKRGEIHQAFWADGPGTHTGQGPGESEDLWKWAVGKQASESWAWERISLQAAESL